MLIKESLWIKKQLSKIPKEKLFPILNIGSSNLEFRKKSQPYIDKNIFSPLRKKDGKIIHLDIKKSKGIDLKGNLMDPVFLKKIKEREINSIIASNLLEHVKDIEKFSKVISELLSKEGYLILTGPHRYPIHKDPIDNGFRPTPNQAAKYFNKFAIISKKTINVGNLMKLNKTERGGRSIPRYLLRLTMPIYRPKEWVGVLRKFPYIFKNIKIYALILKKNEK